ncbi:MAG: hypothetical protein M1815_003226 [Lichina confinis]|nr:MAG: hypothetical protein M1815_003226 [Lichina confinis]
MLRTRFFEPENGRPLEKLLEEREQTLRLLPRSHAPTLKKTSPLEASTASWQRPRSACPAVLRRGRSMRAHSVELVGWSAGRLVGACRHTNSFLFQARTRPQPSIGWAKLVIGRSFPTPRQHPHHRFLGMPEPRRAAVTRNAHRASRIHRPRMFPLPPSPVTARLSRAKNGQDKKK